MSVPRGTKHLTMCDHTYFASGWDAMVQTRTTQHYFEVAMDQALEAYGISFAQYRALELVIASPNDLHVSELARRLRLSRQSASLTVEKLVRGGYVATEREPHARYVVVTELGRTVIARMRDFADMPADLERDLSAAELGQLVLLLRRAERATRPPRRPTWWLEP